MRRDGGLQLDIDRQLQVAAGHGRRRAFAQPPQLASVGVPLVEISTLASAELLLVEVLQPLLSDDVARLVKAVLRVAVLVTRGNVAVVVQFVAVDRAGKAEDVRHGRPARVLPGQNLVAEHDAGEIELVRGQLHRHFAGDVGLEQVGRLDVPVVPDDEVEEIDDLDTGEIRLVGVELGGRVGRDVVEFGVVVVLELRLDPVPGVLVILLGRVAEQPTDTAVDLILGLGRDRARVDHDDVRQAERGHQLLAHIGELGRLELADVGRDHADRPRLAVLGHQPALAVDDDATGWLEFPPVGDVGGRGGLVILAFADLHIAEAGEQDAESADHRRFHHHRAAGQEELIDTAVGLLVGLLARLAPGWIVWDPLLLFAVWITSKSHSEKSACPIRRPLIPAGAGCRAATQQRGEERQWRNNDRV